MRVGGGAESSHLSSLPPMSPRSPRHGNTSQNDQHTHPASLPPPSPQPPQSPVLSEGRAIATLPPASPITNGSRVSSRTSSSRSSAQLPDNLAPGFRNDDFHGRPISSQASSNDSQNEPSISGHRQPASSSDSSSLASAQQFKGKQTLV